MKQQYKSPSEDAIYLGATVTLTGSTEFFVLPFTPCGEIYLFALTDDSGSLPLSQLATQQTKKNQKIVQGKTSITLFQTKDIQA